MKNIESYPNQLSRKGKPMTAKTGIAVNEVLKERDRQDFLKAQGRFKYTCADLELPLADAVLVLGEEFGELCRAYLELKQYVFDGSPKTHPELLAKMREEAIQVTAVGLAIVERFVDNDATV